MEEQVQKVLDIIADYGVLGVLAIFIFLIAFLGIKFNKITTKSSLVNSQVNKLISYVETLKSKITDTEKLNAEDLKAVIDELNATLDKYNEIFNDLSSVVVNSNKRKELQDKIADLKKIIIKDEK